MSHLSFYLMCLLWLTTGFAHGQKKWTGLGNDEHWDNPLNWESGVIPADNDEVVIDNSIKPGSYTVRLPAFAVAVKTIAISPAESNTIELILPPENVIVPGLVIVGATYGLVINRGGIFRNASGANAGTPLVVSDSIRINNGGMYIHNTARGHAENVGVLSISPGTEKGTFVFDVPDASTTLSFSGRTYGRLVLSAATWGAPLNYTAAGTNGLTIRDNFEMQDNVRLSFNFSDTVHVLGDFIQHGGVCNLGNTARNVVLSIHGNLSQSSQAVMTESGTCLPEILITGNKSQYIAAEGEIEHDISFTKDGTGNLSLQAALQLPFKLILRKGAIVTTNENPLVLSENCLLECDSLYGGYVSGPMTKKGLQNESFLFPVGYGGNNRWLRLYEVAGDVTVRFARGDPSIISPQTGDGLHHISKLEYWHLLTDQMLSLGSVRLSFHDPQSGGVTNLADLRVAKLENGIWENAGNAGFGGSPGSNGWVNSMSAAEPQTPNTYYTLASAAGHENPLPILSAVLKQEAQQDGILFRWTVVGDHPILGFELQQSTDTQNFTVLRRLSAPERKVFIPYTDFPPNEKKIFCRIQVYIDKGLDSIFSSPAISFSRRNYSFSINRFNNVVGSSLNFELNSDHRQRVECHIVSAAGIRVKLAYVQAVAGRSTISIPLYELSAGSYYLLLRTTNGRSVVYPFLKLMR